MRRGAGVVAALLCGTPAVAATQSADGTPAAFQGVIAMQVRMGSADGKMLQTAEYVVKGNRVRVDLPGAMGGVAMLVDLEARRMTVLMTGRQQYLEQPWRDPAEVAAAATAGGAQPRVTRTGRSETIAGIRCEHVSIASGTQTADVCLTTALGRLALNPMDGMGRASGIADWQQVLGRDGFPLRVTLPDGTVGLEVTRVERKRIANERFTVPLSYTRLDAPKR